MRLDPLLVVTLMFGIFFTAMTGLAWARRKRFSAVFLGVIAAADLAIAFDLLTRAAS